MLKDWINKQNQRNVPVSMGLIQAKARELYAIVTKDDAQPKPFVASSGWFSNYKVRFGFHNVKFSGEAASADKPAADAFIESLKKYMEENDYLPEQVFNLDETSLYPYRTFERTYISEEEKKKPGFKASKQRLTLLLGTNLVGHKLKPLLIGKSEKPHCFKGVIMENLPCHYYYSPKGWMTSLIWGHYTSFNLDNELKNYCRDQNIDYKILLLCDNFSGHNEHYTVSSENIRIMFLPANTTSLIQPMDQGIIRMFKVNYTRISLHRMVAKIDADDETDDKDIVRDFMKKFNLKHAIHIMNDAWQCVSVNCIKGAWRKLCPDLLGDFGGFSMVDEEARLKKEMLDHAKHVGFDEDDVDNLLSSHDTDITTDELLQLQQEREEEAEREAEEGDEGVEEHEAKHLNVKLLSQVFANIDAAMKILEDNDPQQARYSQVAQNVRQDMRCYSELLRNFRAQARQSTIDSYFVRPRPSEPQESTSAASQPQVLTSRLMPEPQDSTSSADEAQPSTSRLTAKPQKSSSAAPSKKTRQMTLIQSLSLQTAFKGFTKKGMDDDKDDDGLPSLEPGDSDSSSD